jgi:hypothetical protein
MMQQRRAGEVSVRRVEVRPRVPIIICTVEKGVAIGNCPRMTVTPASELSLAQLQALMHARRRQIERLQKGRSRLEAQIKAIDEKIAALGGPGVGGKQRRARNAVSLIQAIADVLNKAGEPMNVGVITEKVLAGGYRSTSPNFRAIVNQTLIKEPQFVSTARGMYRLKKG